MPTVKITSLGGIDPNIEPVSKSGVTTFCEKSIGVGLSTFIPLFSKIFTKLSNCSLALKTLSSDLGPQSPFISESSGTLASSAGSAGGICVPSAIPTITCFKGSHSFQEFTIVLFCSDN